MTSEPRKASDIILELEKKFDIALSIIRTMDMNIKILSNKLNSVTEALEKKSGDAPKFVVEAVNTSAQRQLPPQVGMEDEKNVFVSHEEKLPLENEPKGFRRTSRPETFAGDDAHLPKSPAAPTPKYPVQVPAPPGRSPASPPPGREAEAVVQAPPKPKVEAKLAPEPSKPNTPVLIQNAIPVSQRVVNANGKSLWLADVEIIDLSSMQQIFKTRTNGSGKWMASLGIGDFRIIIRRLDNATKQKLEVTQDIQIDGSQSPLELQTAIIKA